MDVQHFIKQYLREIESGNAAIFAGAGLSVGAGYVNWKELLRPLAEELKLNVDEEHDLVALAQYHENKFNRQRISQQLLNEMAIEQAPTANHKLLASLPISTYWTTNYDKLIESTLTSVKKVVDVKYTNDQLAVTKPKRDVVLYKMHGDIDTPNNTVLTRNEYEKYPHSHAPFITALSGDLVSKTFLFIGFSFTDPNLHHVLTNIRIQFEGNQRNHYCILRRENRADYNDEATFVRAETRQQLFADDLGRFHINVVFIDEFEEVTQILEHISRLYKRKTVFVSGSASDFGNWSQSNTEDALQGLGRTLIDQDYRLVSGIGLGIGNALISGAIQSAYQKQFSHLDERLIMRPFPQYIEDHVQRAEIWHCYRQDLIGKAGIAIFILGNKQSDGDVVVADGVLKEFEIAKKLNLAIVPVGFSGFAAEQIWQETIAHFEEIFPGDNGEIRALYETLGRATDNPMEMISRVLDVLNALSKE
ncbi:SIR2 family protein [Shewanella sedimentimangrovi]|uniref:NAD(+) hydrolase ThsA n=2 Tax=Shewanella sedimentimangrovi TaxID=2814293 RepID=A0ABX7R5G9_9GAMM|nr:SIR2 family protein [Shewanella sedimentimangrovi]